jgi:hypothetical protein
MGLFFLVAMSILPFSVESFGLSKAAVDEVKVSLDEATTGLAAVHDGGRAPIAGNGNVRVTDFPDLGIYSALFHCVAHAALDASQSAAPAFDFNEPDLPDFSFYC